MDNELEYLRLKVKCADLEIENKNLKEKLESVKNDKHLKLGKHLVDLDYILIKN